MPLFQIQLTVDSIHYIEATNAIDARLGAEEMVTEILDDSDINIDVHPALAREVLKGDDVWVGGPNGRWLTDTEYAEYLRLKG